jgi:hypothetical protein
MAAAMKTTNRRAFITAPIRLLIGFEGMDFN